MKTQIRFLAVYLIIALAMIFALNASAAEYRVTTEIGPDGKTLVTKIDPTGQSRHFRTVGGPHLLEVEPLGPTTALAELVFVTGDQDIYAPGSDATIRGWEWAAGKQNLSVNITENYFAINAPPNAGPVTDGSPCDGCNGGSIPQGLVPFESRVLYKKHIPDGHVGLWYFFVNVQDFLGNVTTTTVARWSGMTSQNPSGIMMITGLEKVFIKGQWYALVTANNLPVGVPMFYYSGALGVNGIFNNTPAVTSTDGQTVLVPILSRAPGDNTTSEGRIYLMTADRSQTATSPSFTF